MAAIDTKSVDDDTKSVNDDTKSLDDDTKSVDDDQNLPVTGVKILMNEFRGVGDDVQIGRSRVHRHHRHAPTRPLLSKNLNLVALGTVEKSLKNDESDFRPTLFDIINLFARK